MISILGWSEDKAAAFQPNGKEAPQPILAEHEPMGIVGSSGLRGAQFRQTHVVEGMVRQQNVGTGAPCGVAEFSKGSEMPGRIGSRTAQAACIGNDVRSPLIGYRAQ